MKRTLTTALLTLGLLSTATFADVVVYGGKVGAKWVAGDNSANFVSSVYLVIDLDTNQSQSIEYFNFFGVKRYFVAPAVQLAKTQAEDRKGKTSTAFSYASDLPAGDSRVIQSGILSGSDAKKPVVIKTDADAVALPTTLKGNGFRTSALTTGSDISENQLVTTSSVLQLNVKETKAANDAKDEAGNPAPQNLAQTIQALAAALEKKKYQSEND